MTRLLCMRLGAGPSRAILESLHIMRWVALSQANIWSSRSHTSFESVTLWGETMDKTLNGFQSLQEAEKMAETLRKRRFRMRTIRRQTMPNFNSITPLNGKIAEPNSLADGGP